MAEPARRTEEHDGELRDAALGVAVVAGRAATDMVSAAGGAVHLVTGSPLAGLVQAVTRPVVEPLADIGRELRDDVAEDAPVQRLAREIVDLVLASLDLDALVAKVDLDAAVARVDIDALVDRVDPNRLLDRVDPNRLLDRVDTNALIERVDVNQIVNQVDTEALIAQTELGAIVARSTSGVVTEALDVVRSQGVGLDAVTIRWVNRLLRRPPNGIPAGPAGLVRSRTPDGADASGATTPDRDVSLQGHYAGGVTRFAAYALDATASTAILSAGFAIFGYAVAMVTGHEFQMSSYPVAGATVAALWYFLWFCYPWSLSGRTLGMAVVGIRVVRSEGSALRPRGAVVRTVTFPLSFLVFGLGFLGILTDRRHRAWHDRFADTAVVYAWDARVARLRFLAKQGAAPST